MLPLQYLQYVRNALPCGIDVGEGEEEVIPQRQSKAKSVDNNEHNVSASDGIRSAH